MPTYEYVCDSSNCEAFDVPVEVSHEMSLDHEESCPLCGTSLRRVISGGVGFVLKGTEFTGKNLRVDQQMRSRTAKAQKKGFIDREQEMGLTPNHEGEIPDGDRNDPETWERVKELAVSRGIEDEETRERRSLTPKELSTYDRRIKQVADRKEGEDRRFDELRTPGIIT